MIRRHRGLVDLGRQRRIGHLRASFELGQRDKIPVFEPTLGDGGHDERAPERGTGDFRLGRTLAGTPLPSREDQPKRNKARAVRKTPVDLRRGVNRLTCTIDLPAGEKSIERSVVLGQCIGARSPLGAAKR